MHTLSDDILLIHYPDLSPHIQMRLQLLASIGCLFNKQPGFYLFTNLSVSMNEWILLKNWIIQGNGIYFWQLQDDGLLMKQVCSKHVLVGTGLLLEDLHIVVENMRFPTTSFDQLWHLARNYVTAEINLEME